MKKIFDDLLCEAHRFYDRLPALQAFAPWPQDLRYDPLPPVQNPAGGHILAWHSDDPLHQAIQQTVPHANWRQSYRQDEVGTHFLNHYGWLELYGPHGHFHSDTARAYIAYWGKGIFYPRHRHEAEEIYSVVSGSACFEADGRAPVEKVPGGTVTHLSNEPHALTAGNDAFLAFILWRGAGLGGVPALD